MRGILLLTCHVLPANKLKTAILLVCLTATFFLPLALKFLIARFEEDLLARGNATPLIVGVRGDRFDLVLKSLYFNSDSPGTVSARGNWTNCRRKGAGWRFRFTPNSVLATFQ